MGRPGLNGHRKFRRLARALGSRIIARGTLELLWDFCYESGDEYIGTSEDLETSVEWTGESGGLTRALLDAGAPEGFGFIEPLNETSPTGATRYRVHDLWHHAPEYVTKRRRREMARLQKTAPESADRRSGNDRQTAPNGGQWTPSPDWQDGDGDTPSPSPSPSPSPGKSVSSTPHAAPEPAVAQMRGAIEPRVTVDDAATVLTFPTVGSHGQAWRLTATQVAEWAELFPGVDVEAEARVALAWVLANPGRRKTPAGMPRFLVGWFSRTNDRGGGGRQALPVGKTAGNLGAAMRFVARGRAS